MSLDINNQVDAVLLIMLAIKSGMKVKSTQSVRYYINLKPSFHIITRNKKHNNKKHSLTYLRTPILPTSIPMKKQSFVANSTWHHWWWRWWSCIVVLTSLMMMMMIIHISSEYRILLIWILTFMLTFNICMTTVNIRYK